MKERRVVTLVIVAGGVGLVVGRVLFLNSTPDWVWTARLNIWWTYAYLWLGLSLILLGFAAWHFLRFRVWKLVVIGLLGVGALLFSLNDFFDGDLLWSRGYSGDRLAGSWLIIASTGTVLIGVLWSAGQQLTEAARGTAWWRRRWVIGLGGFVVLSIIGLVFLSFAGDEASPRPATDFAEQDDEGPAPDEWSISLSRNDEGGTMHNVRMIKTFSPLEEADVEALGGRLVWPETQIDVCGVEIQAVGDGFVQVGNYFPAREECEPVMVRAFDDFGMPQTACLLVRSNGVDEEYCAPLAVD